MRVIRRAGVEVNVGCGNLLRPRTYHNIERYAACSTAAKSFEALQIMNQGNNLTRVKCTMGNDPTWLSRFDSGITPEGTYFP
jgi:hypothetical protein